MIRTTLLFLIIFFSGAYADLVFNKCKPSDVPGEDNEFRKSVQDANSYNLIAGFGESDFSFSPDEIDITFKTKEDCEKTITSNILRIHAHNGDSDEKKNDRSDVERNFGIAQRDSYFYNVLLRNSSDSTNFDWVFYGKMLKLVDDYSFSLNEDANEGDDPINGINNSTDLIKPNTKFLLGSAGAPCRIKLLNSKFSIANETLNGPCILEYEVNLETGPSKYQSSIQIIEASNNEISQLTNLIRLSDNKHVGYVRLKSDNTFEILDLDGEVLN